MNQPCKVRTRLVSHLEEGFGKRIHGRERARAIRGIPKNEGLANWSKKLSIMVSFRALFLVFLCFGLWVRLEKCVLRLLGG